MFHTKILADCNQSDGPASNGWNGFKIIGDNIDMNFRRTFQRLDYSTVSQHFFHAFAVKDRVDLRDLSGISPNGANVIDVQQLLPSDGDIKLMKDNFITLISRYDFSCVYCFMVFFYFRVLVSHVERFMSDATTVMWHIPHKFSKEMSEKSTTVSSDCVNAIVYH